MSYLKYTKSENRIGKKISIHQKKTVMATVMATLIADKIVSKARSFKPIRRYHIKRLVLLEYI